MTAQVSSLLQALVDRANPNISRPLSSIQEMEVSVTIWDNAGGLVQGTIDAWGMPDISALARKLTPDEILARFACLAYMSGASEEVVHNIVGEGIERARDWLRHHNREQAIR